LNNEAHANVERALKRYIERRESGADSSQLGVDLTVSVVDPSRQPSTSCTSSSNESTSITKAAEAVPAANSSALTAQPLASTLASAAAPQPQLSAQNKFDPASSQPTLPLAQPSDPSASSSSSTANTVPQRTARSAGVGLLQSAAFHSSKFDAIAAPLAAYLMLGGQLFHYSHSFSPLPYRQGIDYLEAAPVKTLIDDDGSPSAAVIDYLSRHDSLTPVSWYHFCQRYEIQRKPKRAVKKQKEQKEQKTSNNQVVEVEVSDDEEEADSDTESTEPIADGMALKRTHPRSPTHHLVERIMEAVPRISGRRLADIDRLSDDSLAVDSNNPGRVSDFHDQREQYAAAVLIMFRPWRVLTDLKQQDEKWWSAYVRTRDSGKLKEAQPILEAIQVCCLSPCHLRCGH
jgi:hypothetical protein